MDLKKIIAKQKIAARQSIASVELEMRAASSVRQVELLERRANEKHFLSYDFGSISTVGELLGIIHAYRHFKDSDCKYCKLISASIPAANNENEIDILPRFGNLIAVLEQELADEQARLEGMRAPSQNDLTRWALKNAVLVYYQNINFPEDTPIVINRFDDRLVTNLAPDFDIIAKIWLQKLDELKRRDDKYTLIVEEFDKAEGDLTESMRGSAFEKQLDRYREEFMKKLER